VRIEKVFITPESPESARPKIASYLQQAGYQATSSLTVLRFQRGSAWGSVTGSPPQSAQSRIAVEVRTGYDHKTWVCAIVVVNLGAFAQKDPSLWQQEMDGLIAIMGGEEVHMGIAAAQALAPAFSIQQDSLTNADAEDSRRVKGGASWFFWIAGTSIVNVIAYRASLGITFLLGLVGPLFIEGFASGMAQYWPGSATLIMILALFVEIIVAGIFVALGLLARKKLKWAFILGMVLYALDGVAWLLLGEYLSAGFHLLGLYGLYTGVRALR